MESVKSSISILFFLYEQLLKTILKYAEHDCCSLQNLFLEELKNENRLQEIQKNNSSKLLSCLN